MEKMKKTLIFLSLLAMTMGFVACSNNDDFTEQIEVPQNTKMTIVASLDATTRTSLGSDGLVKWSVGDKILIKSIVAGGQSEEFVLKTGAGSTQATFEGNVLANGNYRAYYGIGADLTLSGAQTYVADNVKDAPMYAKVTVADGKTAPVQFKNLCGILELTIKKSVFEKVRSIIIGTNESLSGVLSVADTGDGITSKLGTGDTKTLVLDCGANGVALTESGVKFNIVMPENNYTGVGIQIFATDGSVCTKRLKSTNLPIARSEITQTSFTATTDGVEKETHEFIDLGLPSGKKWAFMNMGAQSKASEMGSYYAWGEIAPKGHYTWNTYKWGTQSSLTKYNSVDGKKELDLTDDPAVMNWGGKWHTPSKADWEELIKNCYIVYTANYNNSNVKGYIVYKVLQDTDKNKIYTGSGTKSSIHSSYLPEDKTTTTGGFFGFGGTTRTEQKTPHIFLPWGSYYNDDKLVNSDGTQMYLYYWTRELSSIKNAIDYKGSGSSLGASSLDRYYGLPIRAVRDADPAPAN